MSVPPATADRTPYTPSQLNALARNLLEDAFPLIWVEGELGNLLVVELGRQAMEGANPGDIGNRLDVKN